ncbi:peptidoglycan-N-acetylglucosamine deacetylase [bacterium BMS3Bbin04]|nr:peptidoglycan-N-acetylglucosamine deacetylase [bacterium BMS3Bbin04]
MSLLRDIRSRIYDIEDFHELGGLILRTSPLLESLFPKVLWGYSSSVDTSPVHLTFDDGPSPDGTPYILDVLARHEVTATFFLRGSDILGNEDLVERIVRNGHRIGYHGLTHDTWWLRNRVQRDIEMNPEWLNQFTDNPFAESRPLLLRAPYGRIDFAAVGSAENMGARFVHWRLTIRDWVEEVSSRTLSRVLYRFTHPGDIILLHDSGPSVRELASALDRVIPLWREAGMNLTPIEPFLESDQQ